jgi:hypothetical protein
MLTVENTGEKLTPQFVATLAEPFLRGTERMRTDHAGVGLGLAIVKSITQAHDGTLTLTPRAAGGLRVTVQLPAAPPHRRGVCQRANGLGTGLGDRYRVPQGRPGHVEEDVDKSPEGAWIHGRQGGKPGPLEPAAEDEFSMVRRGSTVRVRQRALVGGKSPEIGIFVV